MKQLYALVCETQRYSAVLDAVIASAGLLRAERKLRPPLAKVTGGVRRVGRESLLAWAQRRAVRGVTAPSRFAEMRASGLALS